MRRKALSWSLFILLLVMPTLTAWAAPTAAAGDGSSRILYFYITPCDECAAMEKLLNALPASFAVQSDGGTIDSPLTIQRYNAGTEEGLQTVQELFRRYNVPQDKQVLPIVFLRDSFLAGEVEITAQLEQKIKDGGALNTPQPGQTTEKPLQPYEWPGIFLTGLVNGFNPCSISMLLFLVTLLLARNVSVLKMGLAFIVGKFLAYVALGTALFSLLLTIDNAVFHTVESVLKYVLLAVVLVVVIINVSDFLAAKNEAYNKIRLQLPVGLRKLNHQWMKRISSVGNVRLLLLLSFGLGILISVGEFLCTGQIYLATILYMIKRSPELNWQTIGAFLVYVLGIVLPLLALTLAIWKGREVYSLSELARRNMPLIKLLNALVFLVFGVILVLSL